MTPSSTPSPDTAPVATYGGSSEPFVGGVNAANVLIAKLNDAYNGTPVEFFRANYTPAGMLDIDIPNNGNLNPDPKREWVPPPASPDGPLDFNVTAPVSIYCTTTANGGWINAQTINKWFVAADGTIDTMGLAALLTTAYPPK